jgi:ATP-dependent RNA helicase DeaD
LPEDVAFRSVDEGGAGDILPARRRRPQGLRGTERVMVAGARSLSGIPRTFGDTDLGDRERDRAAPPPATAEDGDRLDEDDDDEFEIASDLDEDDADAAHDDTADDDDDQPAAVAGGRRRGRRGGRRERERREARARHEGDDPRDDVDQLDDLDGDDDLEDDDQDDEVHVDQDHSIEAIEELPAIVEEARSSLSSAQPAAPPAFTKLGLSGESLAAISRFGFTEPTPIQAAAIPELLAGKDVVGLAQTGSGKTLAFGLPMVERIDAERDDVQAVVMVPTRELAQQVLEVLTDLGRAFGLRTVGLLGGHALKRDFANLEDQPQIVVGTPGRVIDHLRRGTLSLRDVEYAVLDEADQMLDIGFLPDIRRILGRTPQRRQTALFSATMPTSIRRLIWQFMNDPVTVRVDEELSTVDSVDQIYFEVASRDKTAGLRELIERELKGRTLVFCKTKRSVDRLTDDLERRGVQVGALHGDMDQRRRDKVVERFRAGQLDILIATNVAARGLDIPEITHVVNYDVPQNAEEYVHRIGRTGRAGRDGKAITFVGEWEVDDFQRLVEEFGDDLNREQLHLYN